MDINKAALIEKILNKDPLTDLSIIEKATLRNCKHECLQKYMNSLPKLLQTINWSNKLDVIEVYNLNANFFLLPSERVLFLDFGLKKNYFRF